MSDNEVLYAYVCMFCKNYGYLCMFINVYCVAFHSV